MANLTGESAPIVRIFLSSSSDVAEERKIARELIEGELQKQPAYRHLKLEVIAWDDPAARIPMLANETPQESVNNARPRPSSCDIVIVILWARMGTPLPETIRKPDGERYLSGTEWEYFDAINSTWEPKPGVLVYRRTEEPIVPARDRERAAEIWEQLDRVDAFFARFDNADGSLTAGVNEYATPDAFKERLRQHLGELIHQRWPRLGKAAPAQTSIPTIPPEYVEWLSCECADVSLLGQERQEGRALTLSQVYVPTNVRGGYLQTNLALPRLDKESLYIPAPAGAGKSTFCRWAVLQSIAATDLAHPVSAPDGFVETPPMSLRGRLPLLIPLRDFHEDIDGGRGRRTGSRSQVEEALVAWIRRTVGDRLRGETLIAHLSAGTAFLLLDGLDEVPVSDNRDGAKVYPRDLLLSSLADALPVWLKAGNRVLLTSRPYGLDEVGLRKLRLPQAPLLPLPTALQDLFVTRWFYALGKRNQARGLIATINDDERQYLASLAENPMMLTALCVLYDSGGRLPEDRHDLYRRIVNNVLFHRFRDEVRQREPARARLEAIAHGMHVGEKEDPRKNPAAEISFLEIDHILRVFAADDPYYERGRVGAMARREELLTRSGLLLPTSNNRAAFYHLSVQEFLAAERILHTRDDLFPEFRKRSAVAEWRPTLMFLFAGKIAGTTPRWGTALLARLIGELKRAAVKANPAPAVFIAEALDLCMAKNYAVPEDLKKSFRELVLDAIEDEVDLSARHSLGLSLGRVRDPRIFDLRDTRAYVKVPAGTYTSKSGRAVEIAKPYLISRYPVTNQQYAAFVDDGGYANKRCWSDSGLLWREHKQAEEPRSWHDRRWNGPNQPVIGVSFWEADAFSTWAGGRLPTEEEWEVAAHGREGLNFPWGDSWKDSMCNTRETGLGVTSPVGIFTQTRSAQLTIEDIVGNVWEWCNSLYDFASNHRSGARRVVRGGAWNDLFRGSRSADRYRFHPNHRDYCIGFRVVRSFVASDTNG